MLADRLLDSEPGIGFAHGVDALGAALITSSLMLGVYTIVGEAADNGWTSSRTLVFGGVALLLFVGFIVREATHPRPLLPLRVFKSRDVSGANLVQALMVAGMFGLFFLGSLYLQRVLRFDALQIGLAFLPVALAIGTLSVDISARLCGRFGARAVLLWGLTFTLAGLALFARAPLDADYVRDILPEMLLIGVGGGLSFPALMSLAMSGSSTEDAGLASGLVGTSAQVGGALGLAVLATVSTNRTNELLVASQPLARSLSAGFHLAWGVGAGLIVFSIIVSAIVFLGKSAKDADQVDELEASA